MEEKLTERGRVDKQRCVTCSDYNRRCRRKRRDVVWERPDVKGDHFGKDRLREVLRESAAWSADEIVRERLTAFRCDAKSDVTFVLDKVLAGRGFAGGRRVPAATARPSGPCPSRPRPTAPTACRGRSACRPILGGGRRPSHSRAQGEGFRGHRRRGGLVQEPVGGVVGRQQRLDPAEKGLVTPGGFPEVLRPGGPVADPAGGVEQGLFAGLRRGHGRPPRSGQTPTRTQPGRPRRRRRRTARPFPSSEVKGREGLGGLLRHYRPPASAGPLEASAVP